MKEEIILSGFGGQGIMLLGKVIAHAALLENKFVSWFPSYGAEVRSGTAHCMVVVSDTEIGSCFVNSPSTAILLNEPSLKKFQKRIEKGGLLILNSSLVKSKPKRRDINIVRLPFTDIASKLGSIKSTNMVTLGVFLARKKTISLKSIFKTLKEMFKNKEMFYINKRAVEEGIRLAKNDQS